MKTRFLLSLCLLFLLSGTTYGQDNKEEQVKAIVESGRFVILFDRANPATGRSVMLSPLYEMRFDSTRVSAYLPYFGRSYNAPADPRKLAIELENTEVQTQTSFNERKGYSIVFTSKTETNENITFYLKITLSGMSTPFY